MPKAKRTPQNPASKSKQIAIPQQGAKSKQVGKKDFGVPKFRGLKQAPNGVASAAVVDKGKGRATTTLAGLAASSTLLHSSDDPHLGKIVGDAFIAADPLDPALTTRDSSARAFARELRKVIERADVIIQVLDARDPEGTRSRWVEEQVRMREHEGKRLIGVVNKIDLVPRSNLEAWLKHLRHSFPVLPFKASTQSQRHNLGASNAPLPSAPSGSGSGTLGNKGKPPAGGDPDAFLPSLSSSLGASNLLKLLKHYAQSRPRQTLTVGIVGYPNVGKSSLVNSLKRSRACAVAAMPGKTRVVQEVALDRALKVLDSPGVVLEGFGSGDGAAAADEPHESEEEKRKRLGEVMLRNCIKVEEIDDPISPVEAILRRVEESKLQEIYAVPPYRSATEFLVAVALTRGRLGKGGVPDLPAAATTVLRDWNAGRIPYHSQPPKIHPSMAPSKVEAVTAFGNSNKGSMDASAMAMDGDAAAPPAAGASAGDAILAGLGEAFDLDGLFNGGGGELVDGDDAWTVPERAAAIIDDDRIEEDGDVVADNHAALRPTPTATTSKTSRERMFTPAELAIMEATGGGALDRKAVKQKLKKAAKVAKEEIRKEREADEDMFDASMLFGGMSVSAPKRPEKPKKKKPAQADKPSRGTIPAVTIDAEAQKELDFMAFLNSVGEGDDEAEMEL